ncbi:U3 small nucleolar RNA-associated protein 6-domain-containing protein [Leucosporidium creatinivorum]|uniref:U3 small nucleolar RNA-associated protein 6-domain-containing protein n=1 Tax=Leucosporidium creatinivorum TaxID=106004 RepID=A0A1Y2EZF0_9BASI|nr:U3 small nucleolar RNA-associated protein 6-domain-containing protein [Leucosporidium creatinivorum]
MEKVQLSLERLLPEIRDLERKKIFSKDEISDIVTKRRGFELALASRDVKPADYLRYIEYEGRLEKLRKTRAGRIQATTKKTLSDHSIAAHVTHLHRLSTRRFPSSLPLWNAFLAHSLTQSSPLLISRTLSSAIAMHPTHAAYWLMASRWESDGDEKGMGGGNEEAARRLCMRALRFLKGKEEEEGQIWKEWIRVECGFAERVRARWAVLGIGKGKGGAEEITRVGEKSMDVDGDEDEENAEVELPAFDEDDEEAKIKREVERQAMTGQEAIIDGAIVRVVIDNALASFKHSLASYNLLLSILRPLASSLRTSLLTHVYTSLHAHFPSSSPSYSSALHILATRSLYDLPFSAKHPKRPTDEQVAAGEVLVEGEKLVDAVGECVEVYWKACKGRKGKGKSKEKASVKVWEGFCEWLEGMAEQTEEENLNLFLTANLTTALSLAPPSPFLSLLHLRHLLRTSAAHSTILSHASSCTTLFGRPSPATTSRPEISLETAEQIWVARIETVVSLSPSTDEIESTFVDALKALPFSGRLWDVQASWIEQQKEVAEIVEWYQKAVQRVLLADAKPPVNFESRFKDEALEPRELIPRRYLAFVSEKLEDELEERVRILLKEAPTLSLEFLVFVLEVVSEGMGFESNSGGKGKKEQRFRETVWERVVAHPMAGSEEWVGFAEELLKGGRVTESADVVRRAGRVLKGAEKELFDRRWREVCDRD